MTRYLSLFPWRVRALLFYALFLCSLGTGQAQTAYSRILSLPVRNSPQATDSVPVADASGAEYRVPFSLFGGGVGGEGDALTTNPLSQFAATTSAQLGGVLTDETGNVTGAHFVMAIGTLAIPTGKTLTASQTLTLTASLSGAIANFGAGLTIASGKTLNVSNSLTIAGTDGSTLNIGTGGILQAVAFSNDFDDLDGTDNVVETTGPSLYSTGAKQTFQQSSTTAGLRLLPTSGDPSAGVVGDFAFNAISGRPRIYNATGWHALATTEDTGAGSSEQTVADLDNTWTNGKTTLRQTVALTANRAEILPAASSFPPGFAILYYDNASSATSALGRSFDAGGSDTLNGGTSPITPFIGNGNVRFATDGVSAWTTLDTRNSILGLQDTTDPTKQAHFSLAGTGPYDAAINIPATASTLAVPATGTSGQYVHGVNSDGTLNFGTPAGSGSVSTFSAGDLSPLFTTTETNPTTTPALTFTLSNFAANTILGNPNGSAGPPVAMSPVQARTSMQVASKLSATAVRTAAYSANVNELVPADATTASFPIALPGTPPDGTLEIIKLIATAGGHTVTINRGGSDVFNKSGGPTSLVLSTVNQTVNLQYRASGAIWYAVGATDDGGDSATPGDRGLTNEIWISLRADSQGGKGTANDPFDGSTAAKFDAVMRGLVANEIVHLGKGTFLTTGSASYNSTNGYLLPAGVKIHGAGMRDTIVKQSAYPVAAGANGHVVFEGDNGTDGAGQEITDMTVDANWQNLSAATATKTGSIALYGNNIKVRRVRSINCYGNLAALAESFPIILSSHVVAGVWQNCVGAEIAESVAENFLGDYGNAMGIVGSQDGSLTGTISGVIRNNSVYHWHGNGSATAGAYGAIGDGISIIDNYAEDCERAVYLDTGHLYNATIERNTFKECGIRGIYLAPSLGDPDVRNVSIRNNFISIADTDDSPSIAISFGAATTGILNNITVEANTIVDFPTGNGVDHSGIVSFLVGGLTVRNNTVDGVLANNLGIGGAYPNTGLTVSGNVTEHRASPLGLADYSDTQLSASEAPSLLGTLRTSGNRTVAAQYWDYLLTLSSNYTIVAGDQLVMEVYCDPASTSFDTTVGIRNASAVEIGGNTIRDQNGHLGYADLTNYAKGVFYYRAFDLTPIIGSVIHDFFFGGGPTDEGGTNAVTGVSNYYLRNVRIIGTGGVVRRSLYSDAGMASAVTFHAGTASTLSAVPYYIGALFRYLPTSDPHVAGAAWLNSGVFTISSG